jgi:hypothetical protein
MTTATDRRAAEPTASPPAPIPVHVGQATAIEQSRAVAEVQAAVVVAQQCPRSITTAQNDMRESCAQAGLAERAFFRYSRGGNAISGPSVHLARELARCWGNVQYGIAELRRDDEAGFSEMQAWAWDVQTNTRSASIFVVPHRRDTRDGVKPLVDMRDVYENNANQGARRLRECIFSILPPWFVEDAKERCAKTNENGGGKPLATRIADGIKAFADTYGVTVDQLEAKLGRKSDHWTAYDVAQLEVTFRSLRRGEIARDEEFPPAKVTAAEITGQQAPPAPAPAAAEPVDPDLAEHQRHAAAGEPDPDCPYCAAAFGQQPTDGT